MKYAGVVVDNNTNATDAVYTYRTDIPDIAVGQKVRVPFSVSKSSHLRPQSSPRRSPVVSSV